MPKDPAPRPPLTRAPGTGRRKLLGVAAAAAILLGGATAAVAQEACSQMQVLLSIAPNHREHVMSYIAPRLKQKLGVELVAEAIGSATMVDRVAAQAANPRITLVQWDVPIGIAACDKGMCAPIDLARAPNAQRLFPWAYSKDTAGQTTVLTTGALGVGFLYNADELKAHGMQPPRSWADLAKPEYAGRLGLTAPQSTMGTAGLVELARLHGGGENSIGPGFDATKAILANSNTVFTWSSEMSNLLQLGDIWIAVNSSNLAPALRTQGLPIQFVLPSEGSPMVNSGLSLVKGGPCQAAAYEYIDLYFSDEFQALRMTGGGSLSPSPTAWPLLSAAQKSDLGLGPEDFSKFTDLDWRAVNANRPAWIERWQREIR